MDITLISPYTKVSTEHTFLYLQNTQGHSFTLFKPAKGRLFHQLEKWLDVAVYPLTTEEIAKLYYRLRQHWLMSTQDNHSAHL